MNENKTIVGDPNLMNVFEEAPRKGYSQEHYDMITNAVKEPKLYKIYEGVYSGISGNDILLNCGFKDYVRVKTTTEELNFLKIFDVKEGDKLNVILLAITDTTSKYSIDGSISMIYKQEAFDMLKNIKNNEYVPVKVEALNKAGYDTTILLNGCEINAFLPQYLAGMNKLPEDGRDQLVGNTYNMCVESFANDRGTWIVSRRGYLKLIKPQYLNEMNTEDTYEGYVTDTTDFGIFIELFECVTGLLHKSNLDEETSIKLEKNDIKPGDKINVRVKEITRKKQVIFTQNDEKSLWDTIKKGDILEGTIKTQRDFGGALIKLDYDTYGLISNNEMTDKVEELSEGTKVKVKILNLDKENRRIYLAPV
jgi:small subunit ribosomal protein S1